MEHHLEVSGLRDALPSLHCGDSVFLSGTVYCARDAAHKRIMKLIEEGKEPPFPIKDAVIYYCGPTPAKPGQIIGSCGPTTSARMDSFMPKLLSMGLLATIGKGGRSPEVCHAMKENGAVYLLAMGGAGAVSAKCISAFEVIAFPELGCESVKKMEFRDFPLVVGYDVYGENLLAF